MNTIAELWSAYEKQVLPLDAPAIQRSECRRAFYAGVRGWLDMSADRLEEGDEPTEADLKWMQDRDDELQAFARSELAKWQSEAKQPQEPAAAQAAPRLGDAPIEMRYRKIMNKLARKIDGFLNVNTRGPSRKTGFVLLVFPYGEDTKGRCNYISNGADRKDIVVLMKEQIARFEGQPELSGQG